MATRDPVKRPTSSSRHSQKQSIHLRNVSSSTADGPLYSRPTSSTGTAFHDPQPEQALPMERKAIIRVHDEAFSKEDALIDLGYFPGVKAGDLLAVLPYKPSDNDRDGRNHVPLSKDNLKPPKPMGSTADATSEGKAANGEVKRYLFIAHDMPEELKAKRTAFELSVSKRISDAFGLKHRANVLVKTTDLTESSVSHVDISFKDEYLSRADMWRLAISELSNKTVYQGQKILFMGTIKTQVASVYVNGRKVQSAFFSQRTKPIFRSESARFVLFIQMSREMWDFNSEGSGEIMFNKVVNGFLPALFKRWAQMKARHLVTIVLFTRIEYDLGHASALNSSGPVDEYHTGTHDHGDKRPFKDFYRVVVNETASAEWKTILHRLKCEFASFRRDTSMHRLDALAIKSTRMEATPSIAMYGNVLEAINMATSQFARDHIDRDLMRTGIAVMLITASPGVFEVKEETLRLTTELLINNGVSIDLVCLPKLPLHAAPIFRYRNPEYIAYHNQESVQMISFRSEDSTPRQGGPWSAGTSSLAGSVSPSKSSIPGQPPRSWHGRSKPAPAQWCYAMPRWLEVSYWTGVQQHRGTLLVDHPRGMETREQANFDGFDIRCKMYELEMSSIMEDAMTQISVTSLQQDALFPSMVGKSREISDLSLHGTVRREKIYAAFSEHVQGPAKPVVDRHSTPADQAFYKALDQFDVQRSEIRIDTHQTPSKQFGRRSFHTGSSEAARKILAEDDKVFGTSIPSPQHPGFAHRKSNEPNSTHEQARHKQQPASSKELQKPRTPLRSRKNSSTALAPVNVAPESTITTPVTPTPALSQTISKAFKFGRQISLGRLGFGIVPAKAASAKIQTEHVERKTSDSRPDLSVSANLSESQNHLASHLTPNSKLAQKSTATPGNVRQSLARSPRSTTADSDQSSIDSLSIGEAPSRPIPIDSAAHSHEPPSHLKSRSRLNSMSALGSSGPADDMPALRSAKADDHHRLYNSKLLAGIMSDPSVPANQSNMAPWVEIINPSNPAIYFPGNPGHNRWHHSSSRRLRRRNIRWRSLCSPASVALTTEEFPTKQQLQDEYQQNAYNISRNTEDELVEAPRAEEFLKELVGLRLCQGFQIVTGPKIAEAFGQKSMKIANGFDLGPIAGDQVSVFMSMGNVIHQLSCTDGTEIEVNVFRRTPWMNQSTSASDSVQYNPAVQTIAGPAYNSRQVTFETPRDNFNWNYVDNFVAGFDDEITEQMRFWRARFLLIPMAYPLQAQQRQGEDTPEEIRLEGIRKITQMWQRHRYVPPHERTFQKGSIRKNRDPNPLDIVYRTEDPSTVVLQEIETLTSSDGSECPSPRGPLPDRPRFRKHNFTNAALAEAIQLHSSKGGIRMQNRRWHFRLHYNCFIGSDMTTWLLENFEDIDDREEAVELGNRLMADDSVATREKDKEQGIFVHVARRHPFRDGQYFYQIVSEYASKIPDIKSGWFAAAKKREASVPSTPISDNKDSPRNDRVRSSSGQEDAKSGTTTPTTAAGKHRPRVELSRVMKFDVDTRKRSYRSELIDLHYDRLHNPDGCYHIRIDWVSVTAKLIEDAVEAWATTAERYGLRLVEAPIDEACRIASVHPFREPYEIRLAARPPHDRPRTHYDANYFEPQAQTGAASRHFYQKAILRRFNFVLDTEAAKNFPSNVDVTYSWGRPDFKYTQYIHHTGVLLAEINDEGNFLLVANRLYNNRTVAAREQERMYKKDFSERRVPIRDIPPQYPVSVIQTATLPTQVPSPLLHASANPLGSPLLRPTIATSTPPLAIPSSSSSLNDLPSLPPSSQASLTPTNPSALQTVDPTPRASHAPSFSSHTSPPSSIILATDPIARSLESFCHDAHALEFFYREIWQRASAESSTASGSTGAPHMGTFTSSGGGGGGGGILHTTGFFASPRLISPHDRDRDHEAAGLLQLGPNPVAVGGSEGGAGAETLHALRGSPIHRADAVDGRETQSLGAATTTTGHPGGGGSPLTNAMTSAAWDIASPSVERHGSGPRGVMGSAAFDRRVSAQFHVVVAAGSSDVGASGSAGAGGEADGGGGGGGGGSMSSPRARR